MTTSRFLQIAAGLAAVQGVAHLLLIATAKPTHGPAELALITEMKLRAFRFSGNLRTYWGFYTGYAVMVGGSCLVESALLWQLATLRSRFAADIRSTLYLLLLANVAHAALALYFFFPLPVIFDALVAICLVGAIIAFPA